jgi:branched-chain amino acid transport system permease protein
MSEENRRSERISTRLRWTYFWVFLLTALCFAAAPFLSEHQHYVCSELFILSLYSVALNIIVGFGGMVSLGHSAYYAIATYACTILITHYQINPLLALVIAPLFSSVGALVIGLLTVRVTTIYFSMLTLAFAQIVYTAILRWVSLTNGDQGIQFNPEGWFFKSTMNVYYLVLIVVSLSLYLTYRIVQSPFGLVLRASRDNRKRIPLLGMSIGRIQLIAFCISAFFTGVAGALFALLEKSADPGVASFNVSVDPILSILLGGAHYFAGPIVGAGLYMSLQSILLARLPGIWLLFMGSCLVAITIYWPRGVMGMLEDPRWLKWGWRSLNHIIKFFIELKWLVRRLRNNR